MKKYLLEMLEHAVLGANVVLGVADARDHLVEDFKEIRTKSSREKMISDIKKVNKDYREQYKRIRKEVLQNAV